MNVKSNLREIGSCLLELDCEVPFREVELITQRILAQENSLEISEDLLAEVQCAVIKEALDAVFQSNDVRIVGVPEIENCDYQAGTLFSFQARCVVYPRPQIRYEKCIFLKDAQTTDSALIQRELVRIAANPAAQVFGMLAYRIE